MPKKHKQTQYKPNTNYVHPSLSSSPRGSSQPKPTLSVNERLLNLRLAQSSPASAERKRELAELSNQRSLPPSLGQGILGLPTTAAPNPRNNNVARSRIRLRTPGPAPPPSWLSTTTPESRYHPARRPARTFTKKTGLERNRPQELARFLNMTGDNAVKPGSLLHVTLRTAAENWSDIIEDCPDSLDVLPVYLRATLLSYLTSIGPIEGVDMAGVQALFPSQSEVSYLDLSGLVGWSFSMKELRRWLTKNTEEPKSLAHNFMDQGSDVLDSWEQEAESGEDGRHHGFTLSSSPTLSIKTEHLTKLSLAFPPPNISWNDLLSLSRDLHTITHLSLAHWPLPTRTPNMTATSYVSNTGLSHPAGATTIYSVLDRDFEESSLVLRQLSENTYCLRWLDFQGCSEWISALTWRATEQTRSQTDDWIASRSAHGPDWNGAWRHVTYVNVSQDNVPRNRVLLKSTAFRRKMAIRNLRLTTSQSKILEHVKLWLDAHPAERESQKLHCEVCHGEDAECDEACGNCIAYADDWVPRMARWVEREELGREVGRGINGVRAELGRSRCRIDHGWFCGKAYPALVVSKR